MFFSRLSSLSILATLLQCKVEILRRIWAAIMLLIGFSDSAVCLAQMCLGAFNNPYKTSFKLCLSMPLKGLALRSAHIQNNLIDF